VSTLSAVIVPSRKSTDGMACILLLPPPPSSGLVNVASIFCRSSHSVHSESFVVWLLNNKNRQMNDVGGTKCWTMIHKRQERIDDCSMAGPFRDISPTKNVRTMTLKGQWLIIPTSLSQMMWLSLRYRYERLPRSSVSQTPERSASFDRICVTGTETGTEASDDRTEIMPNTVMVLLLLKLCPQTALYLRALFPCCLSMVGKIP
jgi:hypothetical protein